MKRKLYISHLFLFAILLVLAHGILPHHHCDNSCKNYLSSGMPESSGHKSLPWHCQAYSHLVLIEQQISAKFKVVAFSQENLLADLQQEIFLFSPVFMYASAITTDYLYRVSLTRLFRLRAPPLL